MRTKLTLSGFNSNPQMQSRSPQSDLEKEKQYHRTSALPKAMEGAFFQGCDSLTCVRPDVVSGPKLNIFDCLTTLSGKRAFQI